MGKPAARPNGQATQLIIQQNGVYRLDSTKAAGSVQTRIKLLANNASQTMLRLLNAGLIMLVKKINVGQLRN